VSFEGPDMAPLSGDLGVMPLLSWKIAPRNGHLMGFVRRADTMEVEIRNLETGEMRTAVTDGGGFYGAVDLAPGRYRVHAAACAVTATVSVGYVTTADIDQADCFRRPHR
jgi:hypothetical protein